jgi:hypothetical protein
MGKSFGMWNVRSLYGAGLLMIVATELSKYKLHVMGVQDVRWDRNGTEPIGNYMFCFGKGNENYDLGTGFFVHKRIISAVKRVGFLSDRMLYIILKDSWYDVIVLNNHASTENKIEAVKDSFYKGLERVLNKFHKYHIKMLSGDFSTQVGREYFSNKK